MNNDNDSDNDKRKPQLQIVNSELGLIVILFLLFGIPLFAILHGLFFGRPAQ